MTARRRQAARCGPLNRLPRRTGAAVAAPAAAAARARPRGSSSASSLGILIGWLWPSFGVELKPLADMFLRMIKMIIAPLLFSTLVVGIAGTGDLKAMGRIGAQGDHLLRDRDDRSRWCSASAW